MSAQLGRIIIYTKRLDEVAEFYCKHFEFEALRLEGDRIVELVAQNGGANIMPVSYTHLTLPTIYSV